MAWNRTDESLPEVILIQVAVAYMCSMPLLVNNVLMYWCIMTGIEQHFKEVLGTDEKKSMCICCAKSHRWPEMTVQQINLCATQVMKSQWFPWGKCYYPVTRTTELSTNTFYRFYDDCQYTTMWALPSKDFVMILATYWSTRRAYILLL